MQQSEGIPHVRILTYVLCPLFSHTHRRTSSMSSQSPEFQAEHACKCDPGLCNYPLEPKIIKIWLKVCVFISFWRIEDAVEDHTQLSNDVKWWHTKMANVRRNTIVFKLKYYHNLYHGTDVFCLNNIVVADLHSKILDVLPPGSKFCQFHAVFGKFWQNRMLATTPPPPPRGVDT